MWFIGMWVTAVLGGAIVFIAGSALDKKGRK